MITTMICSCFLVICCRTRSSAWWVSAIAVGMDSGSLWEDFPGLLDHDKTGS